MSAIKTISPKNITPQSAVILDVRNPGEHADRRLACDHVLVPLDKLDPAAFIAEHHLDGSKPLYILCHAGKRAAMAADMFHRAGFDNVHVIEGGIVGCMACGTLLK